MNNTIIAISIVCATIVFIAYLILQHWTTSKMLEADKAYKEYDENGKPVQEGVKRNRWDLSYFPAFSRIFFHADWKIILAVVLLIMLAGFYAVFRDNSILDLIKVNVGAIIGTLVETGKH